MTATRFAGRFALRAFLLAFAVCGTAWPAPPPDPNEWKPDMDAIANVDRLALQFQIPEEFGSLKNYARYYWGTVQGGHRVIEGSLLSPQLAAFAAIGKDELGKANIGPENSAPSIADGGCTMVFVRYDVDAGKIVEQRCNFELFVPPPPPKS